MLQRTGMTLHEYNRQELIKGEAVLPDSFYKKRAQEFVAKFKKEIGNDVEARIEMEGYLRQEIGKFDLRCKKLF